MKKTIIAMAVAAMANIVQADTTLYGSIRESIEWTNVKREFTSLNTGEEVTSIKDSTIDVVNQASRFGIKGDEDLGNGMKAVYRLEFGVLGDVGGLQSKNRLAFAGLKTAYGTATIGKQKSPYKSVLDYNDIFHGSSSFNFYQGPVRLNDVVIYKSPEIWGAMLSAAMVFGTGATENEVFAGLEDQDQIDQWNIATEWDFPWLQGFTIGASYLKRADDSGELAGASLSYQNDLFYLGFLFEGNFDGVTLFTRNDLDGTFFESEDDAYHYNLAGEYYLTDADTIRASVAFLDQSGAGDAEQYIIGVDHKFSKRTLAWLEYSYTNGNEISIIDDGITNEDTDDHLISIGFRHDF